MRIAVSKIGALKTMPSIGMFYVVGGEVTVIDMDLDSFKGDGKRHGPERAHEKVWEEALRRGTRYPYDFFPRGHVEYDDAEETSYVIMDPCLKEIMLQDPSLLKKLINEFHIDIDRFKIGYSKEYRCKNCRGEGIVDFDGFTH